MSATFLVHWDNASIPCDGFIIIDTTASCSNKPCPCNLEDDLPRGRSERYITATRVKKGDVLAGGTSVVLGFVGKNMKKSCGNSSVTQRIALLCGRLPQTQKWKIIQPTNDSCFEPVGRSIDLFNGGSPPRMTFDNETPGFFAMNGSFCCCGNENDFVSVGTHSSDGDDSHEIFK